LNDPLHDGPDDESLEGFFEVFEEGLLLDICPPEFVAPDFPLLDVSGLLLLPFGDSDTCVGAVVAFVVFGVFVVLVVLVVFGVVDGIFICFPDRVVIIFAYLSSLSSLLLFSSSSWFTLFCK
jgi:hypothetical protein